MKTTLKSRSRQKIASKLLLEPRNASTSKDNRIESSLNKKKSSELASSLRMGGAESIISLPCDDVSAGGFIEWNAELPRKWDPFEDGSYKVPHVQEPNETNFMGGLGPNVGHARNTVCIQRPTEVQKIYNMRTRNQPVFTFCEDPRLANNVVQKKVRVDNTNVKLIAEKVERMRLAQNVPTPPPSDFSEDPTEIFDDENPLDMDYQGLDSKETYQRDEQEVQNRREYCRQKRYIDKKALAAVTFGNLKNETRQKRYGLPDFYNLSVNIDGDDAQKDKDHASTIDWKDKYRVQHEAANEPIFALPLPDTIPFVIPPTILATLTRTNDKISNIEQREMDDDRRRQEMIDMQEKTNRRLLEQELDAKHQKQLADETQLVRLADEDFEQYFADDYAEILKKLEQLPPVYERQTYPHTLREAKHLRHKLNRSKRQIRDEAKVRLEMAVGSQQFKKVANIYLQANDESSDEFAKSLSEQSTDDEDALSIGPNDRSQYKLRGFHYLMGDELRGRDDVKPKNSLEKPKRGCATRKEWFDQLAPSNVGYSFFKNNLSSVPSKAAPTDPDFVIFSKEHFIPKPIEISPIKDMLENVHSEPKIINAKIPKIKKPYRLKIKRFNMTGYIFGKPKKDKSSRLKIGTAVVEDKGNKYGVTKEKIDKIDGEYSRYLNRTKAMRHNRMRTLGIPITEEDVKGSEENEVVSAVMSSNSSSADWIPEKEEQINTRPADRKHPRKCCISSDKDVIDQSQNTEPVSRNLKHSSKHSVSSDDSRGKYAVPRLGKLDSDIIHPANLSLARTDITDAFNVRHHHDHQDHTQHKHVSVQFQPKLPKFKLPPVKKTKAERAKPFQEARPLQRIELNEDFSVPKVTLTTSQCSIDVNQANRTLVKESRRTLPAADAFHTRKDVECNPDKLKFLNLIQTCNKKSKGKSDDEKWFIDKVKFVNELREELASIKSCNSSRSSSICTNNTNDSGSFLELEGTKVPIDFITKPQVPFDKIERCRTTASVLKKSDEYYGPYYHVPFAGQKQDMRQLSLPKDKFFTSGVRNSYGIRNRLQVDVPGFAADHIGKREKKFISQLATEWDDYYQNEIKIRPSVRRFKPRTVIAQAREALRNRFQSNFIQEAITENAVIRQKEIRYAEEVERFRDLCQPLFSSWQDISYRSYMQKMQDVKPYFLKTVELKKELQRLNDLYSKIETQIIHTESKWRRLTILQNFHYLLGEQDWRAQHDWIHKRPDGSPENYRESIQRRASINLREIGGKESAFTIKRFYEQFFIEKPQAKKIHIVFNDSKSLLNGMLKVKTKSFICLQQLHFSMWALSNMEHAYVTFKRWSDAFIAKRKIIVNGMSSKKNYLENLAVHLEAQANATIDGALKTAVSDKKLRTLMALCDTLFLAKVPQNIRENMKSDADMVDKFRIVVNIVMDLLEKLDRIPRNIRLRAERKCRSAEESLMRQSQRACATEERIKQSVKKLKLNLAPPCRPQRPPGKLPRSILPKPKRNVVVKRASASELEKLLIRAFTDENENVQHQHSAEDLELLRSLHSNCIPFHFDHFLRLHDYFPSYDFKTQIEMRDGDEAKRFRYDDVLDDVYRLVGNWERRRKEQVDEDIRKTLQLYNLSEALLNLILVGSANSVEIGVLGTTEVGESPIWTQYTMLDEARPELPLSSDKQETYPIGMAIETGCTHQLIIDEEQLPVMPMLHLLSTIGTLISFDIINKRANSPGICSPPAPLSDTSGTDQFRAITPTVVAPTKPAISDVSFGGLATSTPTQKPKTPSTQPPKEGTNLFGSGGASTLFGSGQTTITPIPTAESPFSTKPFDSKSQFSSFGSLAFSSAPTSNTPTMTTQGSAGMLTTNLTKSPINVAGTGSLTSNTTKTATQNANKPYLTVAPTYTPTADTQQQHSTHKSSESGDAVPTSRVGTVNAAAVRKMLAEEMQSFEIVFNDLMQRSRRVSLNFGTKQENEDTARQLNDLQTFIVQATESTDALTAEIQSLRISLDEAFSMATEAKSKHEYYNQMDHPTLWDRSTAMSQTNRRELNKLEKLLATNEQQFRIVSNQIDAQWSVHQDNVRANAKAKMYVPEMENIYSTLSGQRAILNSLKNKIKDITAQIGYRDLPKNLSNSQNISGLTDSIFSMSLCEQVKQDRERLSKEKATALRELLASRTSISIVKPLRPDRKGVNSEVVIEKKLAQIVKSLTIPATTRTEDKPSIQSFAKATAKVSVSASVTPNPSVFGTTTAPSAVQFASTPKASAAADFSTKVGVPAKSDVITHAPAKPAFGFSSSKPSADVSAFSSAVPTPFSFKTADSAPKVPFGLNFNKSFGNTAAQPAAVQPVSSNTPAVIPPAFGSPINQKTTAQLQPKPQPSSTQGIFDKLNATSVDKENSKPTFSISTTTTPTAKPSVSVASTPASVFGATQAPISSSTSNLPGNQTNFTAKVTSSLPVISSAAPSPFSGGLNLAGTLPVTKPTTGAVISPVTATPPTKTAVQPEHANLVAPSDFTSSITNCSITKPTFTSEPLSPIVADNTDNLFQGLCVCKPSTTATTATATPPASGASIFGGSSFVLTSTPDSSTSIFSGAAATAPPNASPFGGSSSFGTQPSATVPSASLFGSFAVPTTAGTSIFGGVPSVPTTSTATSIASSASVFGGTATSSSIFSSPVGPFGGGGGTSIFGGNISAVAPAAQNSPFGGVVTSSSSPFGGVSAAATSSSPFGGVSAAATSSSPFGGGIFAQAAASTANAFKQSAPAAAPAVGTSIFGGVSAFGNTAATSAPATSSIFGGSSSTLAPSAFGGGGVFGGGSTGFGTSSIFGGATGFGAAPSTGSGSFMQGGSSILQTGFAAPATAGAPAPVGGFGGPPAFGTPSFGGAATFGSPKGGFGAFGQATSPTGFNTQVTQKNSLFESLGATENAGMTFGNIAQSSNANAPNPSFTGGSSFSSWR